MFSILKSSYNMIDMQENYIKTLKIFYKNVINQGVKDEAVILRDMLAKAKEFRELRRIEKEYGIVPLPKQNGEE